MSLIRRLVHRWTGCDPFLVGTSTHGEEYRCTVCGALYGCNPDWSLRLIRKGDR